MPAPDSLRSRNVKAAYYWSSMDKFVFSFSRSLNESSTSAVLSDQAVPILLMFDRCPYVTKESTSAREYEDGKLFEICSSFITDTVL